jgi:hypothetical protein
MDFVTMAMIGGFILLILATIWNILVDQHKKNGKEQPTSTAVKANPFYNTFITKYGFTMNPEANLYTGVFQGRNVQLLVQPPSATMNIVNPKEIRAIIEKGIQTDSSGLIDTPIEKLSAYTIKSNYPMLLSEIFDDDLIKQCKEIKDFSFVIDDIVTIRYLASDPKELERLLKVAVVVAKGVEALNYAYG